ncbi:MAG: hypothetical protein WCO96_09130 [Actinomycetes bacterium]
MAATNITDELIDQIAKEIADKYNLGDAEVREIGSRLAGDRASRSKANKEFARKFMSEHAGTFDRLGS